MKLVAISDTHNKHCELKVPSGDILIHAGDFSRKGSLEDLADFNQWLGELPHKYKILIAGNHDFCFQNHAKEARSLLTNAIYLEDSCEIIEGIKIYGSPWQPWFFNWAFNLKRGQEIAAKWALIPEDTKVVITHGPPYGILDKTKTGVIVGCEELLKKIEFIQPKYHIFGHIHEGYGVQIQGKTTFINASSCDASYRLINPPIVVDF